MVSDARVGGGFIVAIFSMRVRRKSLATFPD